MIMKGFFFYELVKTYTRCKLWVLPKKKELMIINDRICKILMIEWVIYNQHNFIQKNIIIYVISMNRYILWLKNFVSIDIYETQVLIELGDNIKNQWNSILVNEQPNNLSFKNEFFYIIFILISEFSNVFSC